MSSPTKAKKAVEFALKVAHAAHFDAVFDAFSMHVGTSDLVQSVGV